MAAKNRHIELTDKGFRLLEDGRAAVEFDWVHITEIVAYRRDPEGADLLCLGFRGSASREYVEVDEEADGYSQLLPALYDAFPAINSDWWQDIARPLGTNRQTIYGMTMSEEDEEPAASKYLKSLRLQKKQGRRNLNITLIMLNLAVIFGTVAGHLSVRSTAGGKWGYVIGFGVLELGLSMAMVRSTKPCVVVMAAYSLACWVATILFQ